MDESFPPSSPYCFVTALQAPVLDVFSRVGQAGLVTHTRVSFDFPDTFPKFLREESFTGESFFYSIMSVQFGTTPSEDCNKLLRKFTPSLAQRLIQSGLCDVDCVTPTYGVIKFLTAMGVTDEHTFCYVTGEIGAFVGSKDRPPFEAVQRLFGMRDDPMFVWNESADNAKLQREQSRVQGRFIFVLHACFDNAPTADDVDLMEDAPLPPSKKEPCDRAFLNLYHWTLNVHQLPNLKILNVQYKCLTSRNFVFIDLRKVLCQFDDKDDVDERDDVVVQQRGDKLQLRKPKKGQRIVDVADFLYRLHLVCVGFAFLAPVFPAPTDKWRGDSEAGVVRGVRFQCSFQGILQYYSFWERTSREPGWTLDRIVAAEKTMRKSWHESYREYTSLECCAMDSITTYRGTTEAGRLAAVQVRNLLNEYNLSPNKGKQPGASFRRPGDEETPKRVKYDDLPGFDPAISTMAKTVDGKQICKPFNDNRQGKGCKFGDKCKFAHACDVVVERDGKKAACGSLEHNRLNHK